MGQPASPWIVETGELAGLLDTPDLVILDASWYLPAMGRDARAEYDAGHIPGAVFFDIDAISDPDTDLPHMLPSPERFARMMGAHGISERHRIVVYDGAGLFSAARAWWTFRVMGARDVRVLNGGLPKWRAEGHAVEAASAPHAPAVFAPLFDAGAVRALDEVRRALESGSAQMVDARSAARFTGEAPEPRAGMRSGHAPGSINLPFDRLLDADGTLKNEAGLAAAFREAGVDTSRPVICSCGSGVTASVLALGLAVLGHDDVSVYDGSWAEWGRRADTPVVTG